MLVVSASMGFRQINVLSPCSHVSFLLVDMPASSDLATFWPNSKSLYLLCRSFGLSPLWSLLLDVCSSTTQAINMQAAQAINMQPALWDKMPQAY